MRNTPIDISDPIFSAQQKIAFRSVFRGFGLDRSTARRFPNPDDHKATRPHVRLYMNALKRVSGTWRGIYTYDGAKANPAIEPVSFTLTVSQGWFGRFTGTVVDAGRPGIPGTGAVLGFFSFPRIEFTKRMPVAYWIKPDGKAIPLREFLIEQGETCTRDVPGPPIFYEGEFSDEQHASGTWIIRAGPLSLMDGRALQIGEFTGDWTMEKAG